MAEETRALRQTTDGIYYLDDYVPVRKFRYYDGAEEFAESMWAFKESPDNKLAFSVMNNKIIYNIKELAPGIRSDKIGLVAVPPSKSGKYSPIKESIHFICQMGLEGYLPDSFGVSQKLYNYSNLLIRSTDIPTKHGTRGRLSREDEMSSISCYSKHLSHYHTTFIILDDITTSGTSLNICRDILLAHGAIERYIIRAAIARTI